MFVFRIFWRRSRETEKEGLEKERGCESKLKYDMEVAVENDWENDFADNLRYRTLVYVEGDASMSQYQDADGKNRSSLNIVQRVLLYLCPCKLIC